MVNRRELLVGSAGLGAGPGAHVLDLGPHHPSAHGGLRLSLDLRGDTISGATAHVGFLHRGVEKLFEARDYRQILSLADRHDWLSAFGGELGVALAVEQMLGIEVPPRARWIRTLLSELTRITHHLAFLGHLPGSVDSEVLNYRERLLQASEAVTGGRMHPMFARIGGVKEDLPEGWLAALHAELDLLPRVLDQVEGTLELLAPRLAGAAALTTAQATALGLSGPIGRASGVLLDERLASPYDAYAQLTAEGLLALRTAETGDTAARLGLLHVEVIDSAAMVRACSEILDGGSGAGADSAPGSPVNVRLPKVIRPPEGTVYLRTENPGGLHGYLLVSRGEKTPWRLKVRTPGFAHAAALEPLLVGADVADVALHLASLCLIVGDIDR